MAVNNSVIASFTPVSAPCELGDAHRWEPQVPWPHDAFQGARFIWISSMIHFPAHRVRQNPTAGRLFLSRNLVGLLPRTSDGLFRSPVTYF